MAIMYTNFTKTQTVSLVLRFSTKPKCLKSSPNLNLGHTQFFSSGHHQKFSENNNGGNPRKNLPWIAEYRGSKSNSEVNKYLPDKSSSNSWEDSKSKIFLKNGGNSASESREGKIRRTVYGRKNGKNSSSWGKKDPIGKTGHSSWEDAVNSYFLRNEDDPTMEKKESKFRSVDDRENGKDGGASWEKEAPTGSTIRSNPEDSENGRNSTFGNKDGKTRTVDRREKYGEVSSMERGEEDEEDEEDKEEDVEVVDDPRWDRIKNKYKRIVGRDGGFEKPEVSRWNKQENWGRKTWKEATESSVPKMHGEGIYGVGPVLAALTVGRREFYALYVQEGLDLSSNNRKKKDKKGVEKVLRIAEKIGLSVKETSKHDLNMVVDNRPHQGLVLDASPLDMVRITELDPVPSDMKKGLLWVALDEVTDPQNLGAIVRSAYFFGAEGVVVCAKNSAPLSGVVSKASAGSLELIELRYCKNMMQFLASSIENGWRVLGGSVSSRALPLNEVLAGEPTILVLGSEGSGLRPLVERSCTHLVRIPGNFSTDRSADEIQDEGIDEGGQAGAEFQSFLAVESLNVSVAAGVLIYHLVGKSKPVLSHNKIDSIDTLIV